MLLSLRANFESQETGMKVNLPAFERAGVMVVGDVMLIAIGSGLTCRISPEAPVPRG